MINCFDYNVQLSSTNGGFKLNANNSEALQF